MLAEDCNTRLLRTLQIQDLFLKSMRQRTLLSEMCDRGPYCQKCVTEDLNVRIVTEELTLRMGGRGPYCQNCVTDDLTVRTV
jgi:hypothetical protein